MGRLPLHHGMPGDRTRRTILLGAGTVISTTLVGCVDDPADDANDVDPDDTDDVGVDDTEPDDDPDDTEPADEPDDDPDEPDDDDLDDDPADDDVDDEPAGVPDDGTIELTIVEDETGDPIEGASVTLSGDPIEDDRTEETDGDGMVVFEDLEFGEYTLTVEAEGYETYEEEIELDDVASYIRATVPMAAEGEDDENAG